MPAQASGIKHYEILTLLGKGGMGEVYLAHDTSLNRKVAIKIIIQEVGDKDKLTKRFSRESKTLAKLSHVNIVKVMDFGEYEK